MALVATGALFTGSVPTPTPRYSAFEVHDSGGWAWFTDPRGVQSGGKVFFGYQDGPTGDVVAASYDLSAGIVVETVLHAALEQDDHDNPGILVRASDQKVVYWYSAHVGADIFYRVSSSALDVSSFAAEQTMTNLVSGGHTYAMPVQLSGEAGTPIRLFGRTHVSGDPEMTYNRSDDGGATWSAGVRLHDLAYTKIATTATAIHFFCSDHPGEGAERIYHFYLDTSGTPAWRKSDGTALVSPSFPLQTSDMTLVYDGAGTTVWVHDLAMDGDTPVGVFATFPTTTDHRYRYARWNGSAWVTTQIVAAGTYIVTDLTHDANQVYYSGGVALDQSDPSIVYASVGLGGGRWDIYRYETQDYGTTFEGLALTTSGKNIRPTGVRNPDDRLRVVWMRGTYADYLDYDVATWGAAIRD
jgi:hypothetical protein